MIFLDILLALCVSLVLCFVSYVLYRLVSGGPKRRWANLLAQGLVRWMLRHRRLRSWCRCESLVGSVTTAEISIRVR